MNKSTVNSLAAYVDALHPIIYINHFDFKLMDDIIAKINENVQGIEFNNGMGMVDFKSKSQIQKCDLEDFLREVINEGFKQETFIVLKDVHKELNNPVIIALLKLIAENNLYNDNFNATVFILSEITVIPYEIQSYITIFDIPLPTTEDILEILYNFIDAMEINVDKAFIDNIALSFKGLNKFQINQILNLSYQNGGTLDNSVKAVIVREKENIIKKSSTLEIVDSTATMEDVVGLGNVKDYLERKARVFANIDKAMEFGVKLPKGIMLAGELGCGKGLITKATARLFEMPLVRLNVGALIGKYVDEVEANMSKALKEAESISPCILWVDEIEKAFAGIGNDNSITARLFEQLMKWIRNKESAVFVVATANNIANIPLEFLRKDYFNELFYVDLPNGEERGKILDIHLKMRNKRNLGIDSIALIKATEGFNGADLEAVVNETVETAFIEGRDTITTDDLIASINNTKAISYTLETEINEMRENIQKLDFKAARKDEIITSGLLGYGLERV